MKYENFEDFLADKHMEEHPQILDDDLPDHFNDWLGNLDGEEYIKYADEYAIYAKNPHSLKVGTRVSAFLYEHGEPVEDTSVSTFVIAAGDIIGKSEGNNLTYIIHGGNEYEFYSISK